MAEHKYAQVLRWIADGTAFQLRLPNSEYASEWEAFDMDSFTDSALADLLKQDLPVDWEFRIKPRTVMCNGVEVPAPESVAPAIGETYYVPSFSDEDCMYSSQTWRNSDFGKEMLERGLVYLRKEDAESRAKAMLITQEVK